MGLVDATLNDKPLCVMNYMYADITEKNIGASMKIHRHLGRRVDFSRGRKFLIELKAITQLENVHLAQAINYIAFELEVGLLINFGATSLQFRRLQNNHKVPHQRTSTNQ
jgi:hypothetical protein